MLDIAKIHEAVDAWIQTNPKEDYQVLIDKDNSPRYYLGLSGLGDDCKRAVWYDFRKVAIKKFCSRMRRLFRRGDREEYTFMWLLRGIGFTVYEKDENGKQFKVTDFEGHLSGSMDGVGEAPDEFWLDGNEPEPFLLEYKSYNDKRFEELKSKGVQVSDPKYYTQCIGYMGYNDLRLALFCAVNKNTDELWFEVVLLQKPTFRRTVALAEYIIGSQEPPERISNNPSWWKCKNTKFKCAFYDVCHGGKESDRNCHSCKHATPGLNASWDCGKGQKFGKVCKFWRDINKQ